MTATRTPAMTATRTPTVQLNFDLANIHGAVAVLKQTIGDQPAIATLLATVEKHTISAFEALAEINQRISEL